MCVLPGLALFFPPFVLDATAADDAVYENSGDAVALRYSSARDYHFIQINSVSDGILITDAFTLVECVFLAQLYKSIDCSSPCLKEFLFNEWFQGAFFFKWILREEIRFSLLCRGRELGPTLTILSLQRKKLLLERSSLAARGNG